MCGSPLFYIDLRSLTSKASLADVTYLYKKDPPATYETIFSGKKQSLQIMMEMAWYVQLPKHKCFCGKSS